MVVVRSSRFDALPGKPTATTVSPSSAESCVPSGRVFRFEVSLTFSTARSSQGALPTSVASRSRPLTPTVNSVPPLMTCAFVTISPWLASRTQPVPLPWRSPSTFAITSTVDGLTVSTTSLTDCSSSPGGSDAGGEQRGDRDGEDDRDRGEDDRHARRAAGALGLLVLLPERDGDQALDRGAARRTLRRRLRRRRRGGLHHRRDDRVPDPDLLAAEEQETGPELAAVDVRPVARAEVAQNEAAVRLALEHRVLAGHARVVENEVRAGVSADHEPVVHDLDGPCAAVGRANAEPHERRRSYRSVRASSCSQSRAAYGEG